MSKTTKKPKKRLYEVVFAVTRSEVYRVRASSTKDAEAFAFEFGILQEHETQTTAVNTIGNARLVNHD